jgi:peptide/nickel transport system substrate-binding protein
MLKQFRFWYWIISSFVKKYALGLTIGSLVGIGLVLFGDQVFAILPVNQTTHIGRIGSYTLAQIPLDIQQNVSRGLTKMNQKGDWTLDVAESVVPTNAGTTYTVTLKPDLTWADGTPLSAADIELTIADVTIAVPDEKTIEFTLKEPFAPFPSILSQPILKKVRTGMIRKKTIIIGLNTYSIDTVETQGQQLKSVTLKSPKNTIVYHFYATEEDALIAFKLGKIDKIEGVTSPYLEDWSTVSVSKSEFSNRYLALFFNTTHSQLQDKSIRQMLSYATPKRTDESRVISPISKYSWAYNPQVKPYLFNMETAKTTKDRLIAANPNLALEFTITTTPAYVEIAQQIIDSWLQLGITTKLKIVQFPDTNEYEVLLIGQQVPDDPDQYPLWHSTQATNISRYQNPKIDKLLEDGRKQIDREARKETYQDFQRFLIEDSPVVFLHELNTYIISRTTTN